MVDSSHAAALEGEPARPPTENASYRQQQRCEPRHGAPLPSAEVQACDPVPPHTWPGVNGSADFFDGQMVHFAAEQYLAGPGDEIFRPNNHQHRCHDPDGRVHPRPSVEPAAGQRDQREDILPGGRARRGRPRPNCRGPSAGGRTGVSALTGTASRPNSKVRSKTRLMRTSIILADSTGGPPVVGFSLAGLAPSV